MRTANPVDNSDWLKTAAIIMVVVGHTGYFFIEDAAWWSVFGRMAAPVFFFLMGYARSRAIPLRWIWLGVILTLLDSWNNEWTWVAPNILLSMALIRISRPYVLLLLQHYGGVALALLIGALLVAVPIAGELVDYGAEGWLWALFGLCQRMYVDGKSRPAAVGSVQFPVMPAYAMSRSWGLMRLASCAVAAVVYIWQEQIEFEFYQDQLVAVMLGIAVLSLVLCLFRRGPSPIQPPESIAGALHFIGWHTLEIYVIQLAGSELIIGFLPELAA